jgi:presenilin-like A22 family membrane protease
MKYNLTITSILLVIFLLSQFLGIAIVYNYIDVEKSIETGKTEFEALPIGERPQMDEQFSYIPIIIMVIVGTVLVLLLMKYNLQWIWKLWFLIAVILSLIVAFTAFIPAKYALFGALLFGLWKVFKPNFWVQNFTELFVYGGLAAIFVPVFNLWSVSVLLVLISIYDAYAVWKSKHMITLAQSQAKSQIFAGLLIPYAIKKGNLFLSQTKEKSKVTKTTTTAKTASSSNKARMAMLGGGDMAFPLLFAGTVLKQWGLWPSLVIPFFALLGLGVLLFVAQEKKFYPAMPFISAGCFLGLGVAWLINLMI